MGRLGWQEFLVVLTVGALVFRPEQLPDVARTVGKALSTLRREVSRGVADLKGASDASGIGQELGSIRRELQQTRASVVSLLDGPDQNANRMAALTPGLDGRDKPRGPRRAPFDSEWT